MIQVFSLTWLNFLSTPTKTSPVFSICGSPFPTQLNDLHQIYHVHCLEYRILGVLRLYLAAYYDKSDIVQLWHEFLYLNIKWSTQTWFVQWRIHSYCTSTNVVSLWCHVQHVNITWPTPNLAYLLCRISWIIIKPISLKLTFLLRSQISEIFDSPSQLFVSCKQWQVKYRPNVVPLSFYESSAIYSKLVWRRHLFLVIF